MRRYVFAMVLALYFGHVAYGRAGDVMTPVPVLQDREGMLNVLVLGSDTDDMRNSGRTDVIMIVSVNRVTNHIAMLSVPRDLYVYIPQIDRYERINTVYAYGENSREGEGAYWVIQVLKRYLGLNIDYYARVDFADFRQIIDALGGVEVAVDCAIEDWRLIDGFDPQHEASWELYTLPVGLHVLDGNMALWYARSRRTSNDLDRGRRQQVLMRAMLNKIQSLNLLQQVTDICVNLQNKSDRGGRKIRETSPMFLP